MKYKVTYYFSTSATVEVEADSAHEAEKAGKDEIDNNVLMCNLSEEDVTVREIP